MADDILSLLLGSTRSSGLDNILMQNVGDPLLDSTIQGLGNYKFDTSLMTPNQSLGLSVGQSFLAGALGEMSQANKMNELTQLLAARKEQEAQAKALERKADLENALTKQYATIGGRVNAETGKLEEIPGWADLLTKKEDITNRATEGMRLRANKSLEDNTYRRIVNLPSYKQLADVASNFNALPDLAKQDTVASDIGLISTIARIRDPNSTVREGEFNINADVQNAFDSIAGNWRKVVEGKSRLAPDTKQALIASVAPKYNELVKSFEESKQPLLEALARQGGDPTNVPVSEFKPFSMNDLGGIKTTSNPDKAAFAAKAKAQGLTIDQARAAWAAQGGT